MTNNVLLNNVDHKDLRVITTRSARYGDDVMYAITFPSEFRNIQAHYPIVFRKNAQGQFEPIALLGFQERQNLFLTRRGWNASYIPLTIERQPFLIGFSADKQPMMHVDLDSPRISRTEGEAVFNGGGYLSMAPWASLALFLIGVVSMRTLSSGSVTCCDDIAGAGRRAASGSGCR